MNIRHTFVALIALFSVITPMMAQELDPTVVVNKAYEGKLVQVHKPNIEMAVPDSLTRFDLDFDYLVSDQPYKGADGFTPYVLTMKPATVLPEAKNLYLNVGAGYTIHPTLDFVWSPLQSNIFKIDVYAEHDSYIGNYRSFRPESEVDGVIKVDRWKETGGDQAHWAGYDMASKAGVDGRFEFTSFSAGFDVSYYGLASKDLAKKRMYDAVQAKLGLSSKPKNGSYFKYDISAYYRFAEDKLKYSYYGPDYLGEHLIGLDATLGQVVRGGHSILFDIEPDFAIYAPAVAGQISLVPRYTLTKGRWTVDAGVRVSALIRSNTHDGMFGARGQLLYPAVKAGFAVIPDAMRLYANVGGGNKLNTYASLLERNHHTDTRFGIDETGLMNVTVERLSASLGVDGRINSVFSYDLRAGYVNYANDVLDGIIITTDPIYGKKCYLPGFGYAPYQKFYASAGWRLLTEKIRFDGNVQYTHAWGLKTYTGLFLPAAVTADVSFEYNWRRRIFAGVDCDFSTGRHGKAWEKIPGGPGSVDAVIPWYADLGVNFEYVVNRGFSVWARSGNLLNMTVQRNPLYAEKGLSLTVGICLNL